MGGGGAYAYFTAHGNGTGSAAAGTLQGVSLSTVGTVDLAKALRPGVTTNAVIKVTNSNAFPVTLVAFTPSGAVHVAQAPAGSGCTADNSEVTFASETGLSITIPASASNLPVTIPNGVTMAAGSDNHCQGATFTTDASIEVQK
jgi:hypothetical protein